MALVTQFLTSIRGFLVTLDGDELRNWLKVDPASPQNYHRLREELKQSFPPTSKTLDTVIEKSLPEEDDVAEGRGTAWPGFVSFMKEYLQYWRDANFDDYLGLYDRLCSLLTSCATALSNPTYGTIMFKTSISLSESLSNLAMILNRRPDLLNARRTVSGDEERKSVVETAADIIQKIFTSCLTDRSSQRFAKPEGKKIGVYIFANLVLKLLFTCRKSRLAAQLLTNIATSGPPLVLYPASQRVTYLYYLGRFNFDSDNFLRAVLCLQEAYLQTPPACQKHRRLILTYLIPSNILLGRFPTDALLSRPEAAPLAPIFRSLTAAVRSGNFIAFQHAISAHERWLYDRGLLFTLTYRLRPLLWRSFTRRTFMLTYSPPRDPSSRSAVTLSLADVAAAATYVQRRLEGWVPARPARGRAPPPQVNPVFMRALANSAAPGGGSAGPTTTTLVPPPGGPRKLRPSQGLFWGNMPASEGEVEGAVAGLVAQGLMHGFVAHSSGRFAIMGAKQRGGPLLAGWPNVAQAIRERLREEGVDLEEVPAWVKGP
ncbi:hypothetical protein NKR23_g2529 [Pleurostoma richardsiae]|uniref:PCI domain-containing protein n=1 Tax=Pleurostoma richardsiae TaxID=41990 RepID=A0AA38VIK1_9PEZI|nr:hypothetical protein NKR23_g2529 [Pleurostoma richardsiae]